VQSAATKTESEKKRIYLGLSDAIRRAPLDEGKPRAWKSLTGAGENPRLSETIRIPCVRGPCWLAFTVEIAGTGG